LCAPATRRAVIGSDYLLERLDYAPQQSLKLIGDAFYESKLIRDSVFAQTGRRFLDDAILSDNQQYQYLMDNALLARKSLQLAPGVALDSDQINRLTNDIVWLVKQRIEGEEVLVPTVYLATGSGSAVRGGKIIAGSDTRLQVATLVNSGLLETGANLAVDAEHEIENRGLLRAQGDLRLTASGDISNLSGRIEARNINLTSREGDINHRREREDFAFAGNEVSYSGSLLGAAAVIQASAAVELEAAGNIEVEGSMVAGRDVQLDAAAITISAADAAENFSAGDRRDHFKESSVTHFASMVNGQDIVILSTGETRVMGSQLSASASLQVTAGAIAIDALSDSESRARKDTEAGSFSKTVSSQQSFRSHSIGSEVNAATVVLITEQGDIELRGSAINATSRLTMSSAGDIRIEAARETAFEESHERKSGWFSGGSIYAESEDLRGRMGDIAVNGQIDAGSVTLDAVGDIEMVGVDIEVNGNLTANGRDITLRHATSEETEYSKHTEISIGATDLVSGMASIDELATLEDGRLKLKLTDAQFDDMESVTRRSSVVASQVQAGALQFNAGSDASGDIVIEGSDIQVENSLELTAVGDVALLDAHNVSASDTSSRSGTAEVYLTAQNEYEQALRAIQDVRDAERDLRHARRDYEQYQKELDAQKDELERLQQDLAAGAGFVEPADVDEFERRLKRLQDDEDFYRTNILFATATLASQTTALVEQTARAAASSATYGFNASLELDVDALERELEEYYRQSRASSLSATNIAINAADTALLRGVNLQAREDIDIEAADLEILAGVNTGAHSERSRHAECAQRTQSACRGQLPLGPAGQ
jgi:adhesin HecA-like repeat protein